MKVQHNVSLQQHNTFGINCKASQFYQIDNITTLQEILRHVQDPKSPIVIGGGSNILLLNDLERPVLKIGILGKEVIHETEGSVVVKVGAGENWHDFVMYALEKNWGGIENLSLIPGTVGAAPMQNIGAYGVEIKDVFDHLIAVDRNTGEIQKFEHQECSFGYRESVFKNIFHDQYVIAYVAFRLTKKNHLVKTEYGAIKDTLNEMGVTEPSIHDVSEAVIKIRQSKLPDPKEIGNAGSFFKNPSIDTIDYEGLKIEFPNIPGYAQPQNRTKVPAGWLIEQCGWKGHVRNDIGVHNKQALVLVNYGGGSGTDIYELAKEIQKSVADSFGIELQMEVNLIQ